MGEGVSFHRCTLTSAGRCALALLIAGCGQDKAAAPLQVVDGGGTQESGSPPQTEPPSPQHDAAPSDAGPGPSDAMPDAPDGMGMPESGVPDATPMPDAGVEPLPDSVHVYVSGENPSPRNIALMRFDLMTGTLAPVESFDAYPRTSYMAISPDKSKLYADSGRSPGRIMAFSIAAETGLLSLLNDVSSAGTVDGSRRDSAASHVTVHASGRWVLASHLPSGHVTVLPVQPDGAVGEPVDVKLARQGAHQVVFDQSGSHFLVPCRDSNVVAQFVFNPETGEVTPNDPPFVDVPQGSGPRHIALHPNERFAYLINQFTGIIVTYDYDAAAGTLSNPTPIRTTPEGFTENAAAHIWVHPNGRFLYATNRDHDSFVYYTLDELTGRPTFAGHEMGDGQLDAPQDFDVDPTGRYLVVINGGANTVVPFEIDPMLGSMTRIGDPVSVPFTPLCARLLVP